MLVRLVNDQKNISTKLNKQFRKYNFKQKVNKLNLVDNDFSSESFDFSIVHITLNSDAIIIVDNELLNTELSFSFGVSKSLNVKNIVYISNNRSMNINYD